MGVNEKNERRKERKKRKKEKERGFISLYFGEEYANILDFAISEKC